MHPTHPCKKQQETAIVAMHRKIPYSGVRQKLPHEKSQISDD
jgi:hypothetical protein